MYSSRGFFNGALKRRACERLADSFYRLFYRGFTRNIEAQIAGDGIYLGGVERHATTINGSDQPARLRHLADLLRFAGEAIFQPLDNIFAEHGRTLADL